MGDKIATGSETVRGRWCLDGGCLLGKMLSMKVYYFIFYKTEAQRSPPALKSFQLGLFLGRSEYVTLASLKIILRALFEWIQFFLIHSGTCQDAKLNKHIQDANGQRKYRS